MHPDVAQGHPGDPETPDLLQGKLLLPAPLLLELPEREEQLRDIRPGLKALQDPMQLHLGQGHPEDPLTHDLLQGKVPLLLELTEKKEQLKRVRPDLKAP